MNRVMIFSWIAVLGISAALLNMSSAVSDELNKSIQKMNVALESAKGFSASYNALRGVDAEFRGSLPSTDKSRDILEIFRTIDFESMGLKSNPERSRVTSASYVEVKGNPIGAIKICISDSKGLYLEGESLSSVHLGLQKLFAMPWVSAQGVEISTTPGDNKVSVELLGFCTYFRDDKMLEGA